MLRDRSHAARMNPFALTQVPSSLSHPRSRLVLANPNHTCKRFLQRDSWNRLLDSVAARGGPGVKYGRVLSLILVGFAVVGVFIEIPFVSNYAFWLVIAAYVILACG
jgi:hypothetical protein